MDNAPMVKAIVANGCYRTMPITMMPSKGDILLYRAHDGSVSHIYKVCGHRPTADAVLCNPLSIWNGSWFWNSQVQVGYQRYPTFHLDNPQWEKMIPADLPNAPVAMPPAQPVEVREVVRVQYRDVPVVRPSVPPHMKEHIKELIGFGKEFECPVCFDTIRADNLHITKCGHFYCEGCVEGMTNGNVRSCPVCRATM